MTHDSDDISAFLKACAVLNKLGQKGFHFFTNGDSLHMLNKHKENGGEILATAPVKNIEGGDW